MAIFLLLVLCNLSFMRCVSEPRGCGWIHVVDHPLHPRRLTDSWVMWQDLCHHSHRNKKDKLFPNKLFPIKIWVWGVLCNCGSNMWALVAGVMLTKFKIEWFSCMRPFSGFCRISVGPGRDLSRSPVQPPSHSRVSTEVRLGCSGLLPVKD